MDVGLARVVFEQRSHQRKRSHSHGNQVRHRDADGASDKHDEQRLGEKLRLDVPLASAESAPQANLPNALIDRDEHDVHDTDAADPEGEDADKNEQHLQPDGDAVDDGAELFAAEHLNRFLVGGGELLPGGDRREHLGFRARLELRCDRFKHQHVAVLRVPKIIRGRVGNPRGLVVAGEIVAELDLAVHGANHREPYSCNDYGFAYGGLSAEQLLAHARSQEGDAAAFEFIERVDPAALRRLFVPHIAVFRADAADRSCPHHAVSEGDAGTAHRFEARVAHIRGRLLDHVQVGLLEDDFLAGPLAARLFAGLLRPADDRAFAERVKATDQNFTEASAVCNQEGDGGDSPYDAEHGESAARAVAAQSDPGFAEDLINHAHASHQPRAATLRWGQWRRRGEPDTGPIGWRWFREQPGPRFPSAMSATGRQRSPAWAGDRRARTVQRRSAVQNRPR